MSIFFFFHKTLFCEIYRENKLSAKCCFEWVWTALGKKRIHSHKVTTGIYWCLIFQRDYIVSAQTTWKRCLQWMDSGWQQFIPSSLPWWKFSFFKWKCSDPEVIPVDALVKSGGVGGVSSSSMQFPCWWWQAEQEFQANLECHLVFLNLTHSGKEWESWTWNLSLLKKHLQNDKLSPWILFWGVCCFMQLLDKSLIFLFVSLWRWCHISFVTYVWPWVCRRL